MLAGAQVSLEKALRVATTAEQRGNVLAEDVTSMVTHVGAARTAIDPLSSPIVTGAEDRMRIAVDALGELDEAVTAGAGQAHVSRLGAPTFHIADAIRGGA